MALFPAFSELSPCRAARTADQEWLKNESFRSDDALSLHHRATETSPHSPQSLQKPREEEGNDTKPKKKKKKKKRKKERKHSGDHSDSGSESGIIFPSDLLKTQNEDITDRSECVSDDIQNPKELFFIDRKSDPANWQYKSLYRGDISRYRRKGSSVLGVDSRTQAVFWDDSVPERKRVDRKPERYFHSSVQQQLRSDTVPMLPTAPDAPPTDNKVPQTPPSTHTDPAPFLPLPPCPEPPPPLPRPSCVDPLGVYDPLTSLYVEGKSEPTPAAKGQQLSGPHSAALLTTRIQDFNRELRENPTNIQLWLCFIRFQDEVCGVFKADGSTRVVLERKLSVFDRALEFNPSSVELKLERIRVCGELWEPAVLLKEWKKLVFLHPNSIPVWRSYLLYTQSRFSSFSVSTVTAAYRKCLSTLSAVQDGSMVSHPPMSGTQQSMLEIFVLQCEFLRQCGHSERALSLYQAQLDFTFNKPEKITHLTTAQQVEFFEPFWDSGEARVGERGARGWRAWMLQQERGGWVIPAEEDEDNDEEEDDSEIKDKTQPKWRIWLDLETARESKHWLPWRPDKSKSQLEEDCEDPDRQVLFDDIGPSLIKVESADLKLRLLLCFLQFLGLPNPLAPPPYSLLLDDPGLLDLTTDLERPLTSHLLPPTGVSIVGHMSCLSDSWKGVGLSKEREEFVKNVLEQMIPLFPPKERMTLSLSWIQYEKLKVLWCVRGSNKKRVKAQVKRSKRVIKRLLKQPENRSSVRLWQEYGHMEWIVGNMEEGRRVFDTALTVCGALRLQDHALCELCLLYAQLEVEQTYRSGAKGLGMPPTGSRVVHILTRLAEGTNYSPFSGEVSAVAILKARKVYEQAVADCGDTSSSLIGCESPPSALIGCFGLFQYLTMGVDAADAVFAECRSRLSCSLDSAIPQRASESVCVQHVALLRLHSSSSVFPLSRLRSAVTDALKLLPCSAPLWRLLLQTESHFHSAGSTRRFFLSVARGNHSILPHLFSIAAETRRKQRLDTVLRSGFPADALPVFPESGLSNRIRGLFEVAVATEQGSHCPLLWRMYMNFMVCHGDTESGRGIFYKALQNVPWVKAVYLDAVQLFPDSVQEVVDLLMEKELRLRVPLEELDILLE